MRPTRWWLLLRNKFRWHIWRFYGAKIIFTIFRFFRPSARTPVNSAIIREFGSILLVRPMKWGPKSSDLPLPNIIIKWCQNSPKPGLTPPVRDLPPPTKRRLKKIKKIKIAKKICATDPMMVVTAEQVPMAYLKVLRCENNFYNFSIFPTPLSTPR